jgi:hypothetical protein
MNPAVEFGLLNLDFLLPLGSNATFLSSPQNQKLKAYFYMAMVASADVETQRKGVVLVVWPGGPGKDWKALQPSDKRVRHLVTQRHEVIPIRFAGYHFCMPDNPIFRLIRSFAVLFTGMGGGLKSRMRFHIGTNILLSVARTDSKHCRHFFVSLILE